MTTAAGGLQPPAVRGSLVDDVAARCGRIGGAVDRQRRAHVVMQRAILVTVQTTVRAVGRGRLDRRNWRDTLITAVATIATAGGVRVNRTGGFHLTAGGPRAGVKDRRRSGYAILT